MIIPYPVTNQTYALKLRKKILQEYDLMEICDLNGTKVFDNATVSNCILFVRNDKPNAQVSISHIKGETIEKDFVKDASSLEQNERSGVWNLTLEERYTDKYANMYRLGDFCYISKGMVLNADEKTAKGAFKKEDLISDTYDEIHNRKYIEAKDIDRYMVKRERYLEWGTERCPGQLSRPTFQELYDCEKVLTNSIGNMIATIDIGNHYLHNHSINCVILWTSLCGIHNKSIAGVVKRYCNYSRAEMEDLSEKISLFYILAILNSAKGRELLTDIRAGGSNVYPEYIRKLPIPIAPKEEQDRIGKLAKSIVEQKCQNAEADITELLSQIDKEVNLLY